MSNECQFHQNCGGYCETPEQLDVCLCEDCLEAEQMDAENRQAILALRHALEGFDDAQAGAASAPSSLAEATRVLVEAARKVAAQ